MGHAHDVAVSQQLIPHVTRGFHIADRILWRWKLQACAMEKCCAISDRGIAAVLAHELRRFSGREKASHRPVRGDIATARRKELRQAPRLGVSPGAAYF